MKATPNSTLRPPARADERGTASLMSMISAPLLLMATPAHACVF